MEAGGHDTGETRQRTKRARQGDILRLASRDGGLQFRAHACADSRGPRGYGRDDRLGHGGSADQLVLTLVAAERFKEAQIVMVAAGGGHSVAVEAEGSVWTWGYGIDRQLGHRY